jgi:8-oxo-dGTP pyrophosphatase MutT (NUDIX family)
MSTTAIVAEILIVGLQTLGCIAAAVLLLAGDQPLAQATAAWVASIPSWKDLLPLITVLLLAAAYSVGILIDRIADMLDDLAHELVKRMLRASPARRAGWIVDGRRVRQKRMEVMHKSGEVTKFLEYQRSRLRIARATWINVALFTALLLVLSVTGRTRPDVPTALMLLLATIVLLLSFIVWYYMDRTFIKSLNDAHAVVHDKGNHMSIVAAICYRRVGEEIELLLVRTKGATWTFPKGHVERGESDAGAAAREAAEEAGVKGKVEKEPLATYLYPKKQGKKRQVDLVRAYLLEVQSEKNPGEDWRQPEWLDLSTARTRLGEKRESWYAEQMAGLLTLAVARLTHCSDAESAAG